MFLFCSNHETRKESRLARGLVDRLSETVAEAGGQLFGKPHGASGGKIRRQRHGRDPAGQIAALRKALNVLEDEGFHLTVEEAKAEALAAGPLYNLDLVGPDHPGILHEITHCLAERGVSVEDRRPISATPR